MDEGEQRARLPVETGPATVRCEVAALDVPLAVDQYEGVVRRVGAAPGNGARPDPSDDGQRRGAAAHPVSATTGGAVAGETRTWSGRIASEIGDAAGY